ncbi:hypothetical protein B296_00037154 [Ensete ventricosum]|uniref:Uncharacterized protein n=1 Tax=Ensete ventricosum TaxID=4639 RepID=A0A426XEY7_ENSVE|nr:hypothetical protein B296_00037154 [Ensete ventricosum]
MGGEYREHGTGAPLPSANSLPPSLPPPALASFRCGVAKPCCLLRLSIPDRSRFKTYRLIRLLARLLLLCKPLVLDGLVCS